VKYSVTNTYGESEKSIAYKFTTGGILAALPANSN
jgi:hypothetical protein